MREFLKALRRPLITSAIFLMGLIISLGHTATRTQRFELGNAGGESYSLTTGPLTLPLGKHGPGISTYFAKWESHGETVAPMNARIEIKNASGQVISSNTYNREGPNNLPSFSLASRQELSAMIDIRDLNGGGDDGVLVIKASRSGTMYTISILSILGLFLTGFWIFCRILYLIKVRFFRRRSVST